VAATRSPYGNGSQPSGVHSRRVSTSARAGRFRERRRLIRRPPGRDCAVKIIPPCQGHAASVIRHHAWRVQQHRANPERIAPKFSCSGEDHMVRTEGADGRSHDYEIAFTFGVYPLQQYLIALPGGGYQALGVAWDSRPQGKGGRHWFHRYPDQSCPPPVTRCIGPVGTRPGLTCAPLPFDDPSRRSLHQRCFRFYFKRSDRLKFLIWDGSGLCLVTKHLVCALKSPPRRVATSQSGQQRRYSAYRNGWLQHNRSRSAIALP
jgi:hypothetical protein